MLFLVQKKYTDDTVSSVILTEGEVVELTNSLDFMENIKEIKVFDISTYGVIKELLYCGWRPMCHIQYVDKEGTVIIDGYGEDH